MDGMFSDLLGNASSSLSFTSSNHGKPIGFMKVDVARKLNIVLSLSCMFLSSDF